ncbi:MAG: transglutaminase domain-containing protein [Acidimicrobiia bacterium]|nr:transglutaminase domain-containing protein [Acidimicrobiia bacterium]
MVYRFTWLAGIAGILFALVRLERLLRSSVEGLPWELVLAAAALLGGALTWAGLAYRLPAPALAGVNLAAMLLTVVRIAVPGTTWFIFPTPSSFSALGTELSYALDVARTGVAPVLPLAGIIAMLAVLFWVLGAFLAWGLRRDHPYVAVLAPLVAYLQFATMDRQRSGAWAVGFVLLLGLALLAVAADRRRRGTGLLTTGPGRAAVARTRPALAGSGLALLVALTLGATTALAETLPRSGLLEWRVPSALTGGFYGSVSFNPFVGIRQQLVSPTDTPLLIAEVSGEVVWHQLYFRLLTLESFNGEQWYSDRPRVPRPEEIDGFEDGDAVFRGPTARATQVVTILALQQAWLPAAYSPIRFSADNRAVAAGYRIKVDDGALYFDALTYRGMTYTVESAVPLPDLSVLALDETGSISPVFAEASAAEAGFEVVPPLSAPPVYRLPDRDRYLDLPSGISPAITRLAENRVRGLATDFEKALALEAYFRDSGEFRYSIQVDPGHAATDLAEWLLDPLSPNYHTGYCEQFATAMAVLARLVDLPSRVVLGFTPGWLYEDGRVVISDRNAHAWVELWMPTQGWVRFDPTPRGDGVNPATSDGFPFDLAGYLDIEVTTSTFAEGSNPSITRPIDDDEITIPTGATPSTGGWKMPDLPAWLIPAAAALAVAFGLLPAIKWARRRRRLRALSVGDVSGAWREIVDRLSDLGDEPSPAATPAEVAAGTDPAMLPLARVYGESIYGRPPGRAFDLGHVVTATRSFEDTEGRLTGRYSRARRLAAWYRLRSLRPRRWRRYRHG